LEKKSPYVFCETVAASRCAGVSSGSGCPAAAVRPGEAGAPSDGFACGNRFASLSPARSCTAAGRSCAAAGGVGGATAGD